MPNINAPKGFVPKRTVSGGDWKGLVKMAYIPSGDGTATYVGDVVIHNSTSGAAGLVVNGIDLEGVPQVIRAASGTAGQNYFGVVVGFLPDQNNLMTKHRAASTNRIALICPLDNVSFEAQEDALVTPIAAASVGLNAAINLAAGSAVTGVSGMMIDSDTVNTTPTLPLKIYSLVKRPDNAFNTGGAGTDPAKFEVIFNTNLFAPNVSGV